MDKLDALALWMLRSDQADRIGRAGVKVLAVVFVVYMLWQAVRVR